MDVNSNIKAAQDKLLTGQSKVIKAVSVVKTGPGDQDTVQVVASIEEIKAQIEEDQARVTSMMQ